MNLRLLRTFDLGLLIPVFILISLGLVTLFSINPDYFRNQFFYVLISLAAFFFFSQVDFRLFQFYVIPMYVISLIILFVLLFIGTESRGAVRWFDVFGLRIQFSEILKPFFVFGLCTYLVNKRASFTTLAGAGLLLLPIAFLIYKQPDLGNALLFVIVTAFVLVAFGFSWRWFILGGAGFLVSLPFLWGFLHDYQKQRVQTFLFPSSDPLGTSYNAIQSIIAVGSGMFFGKGLSQGTQSSLRFLPERHTDFIFATLSEDLGFIGAVIVLVCFGFLLFRIYSMYSDSQDNFGKLFAIAAFFLILIQFFVNVGMNIGIMPIVGVTLPFVSFGGSSMLSNFILLGLLCSVYNSSKGRGSILEIK